MKHAQVPRLSNLLIITFLSALCCSYAHGQSASGSIHGVVSHRSGSVIGRATIRLICRCNECPNRPCSECCPSGFSRTATSDEDGRFKIDNVPTGVYLLTGQAAGFKEVEVHGVEVKSEASQSIDVVFDGAEPAKTTQNEAAKTTQDKSATVTEAKVDEAELQVKLINRDTRKPLENAKVTFRLQCDCKKECPTKPCSECCPSEDVTVATTDATGVIKFNGPAGTYLIDTAYGAVTKETLVRVKTGETEKVKIALTMAAGGPQ